MAVFMTHILSHWSHHFPFWNMSSDGFYRQVDEVIKSHGIPEITVKRVKHKEKGIFSASREYLQVQHRDLVFDICASPYGRDFFVSWWLYESEDGLRIFLKHTKVGDFLDARAAKRTFLEADKEALFKSCIHSCILETIAMLTQEQSHRLSDLERQIHIARI